MYYSGGLSAGLDKIWRNSVKITRILATHPNTVLPQQKGESTITRIAMYDKLKSVIGNWNGKKWKTRSFMICIVQQILLFG
jgi:hypothetical protein